MGMLRGKCPYTGLWK